MWHILLVFGILCEGASEQVTCLVDGQENVGKGVKL